MLKNILQLTVRQYLFTYNGILTYITLNMGFITYYDNNNNINMCNIAYIFYVISYK
jgi:hypothetical protein